jgi:excisionase family DNA binding protein
MPPSSKTPPISRLDTSRFTPEQLLLTVLEAGEMLRVSRTTVYALLRSGVLRPVHIGRSCRISVAELRRYLATLEPAAEPLDVAL